MNAMDMGRSKNVAPKILDYMKSKNGEVTFLELYDALKPISKQGIRNGMYQLLRGNLAVKIKLGKRTVRFKLKGKQ